MCTAGADDTQAPKHCPKAFLTEGFIAIPSSLIALDLLHPKQGEDAKDIFSALTLFIIKNGVFD